jgi:hypothetical protein
LLLFTFTFLLLFPFSALLFGLGARMRIQTDFGVVSPVRRGLEVGPA